MGNEQASDVFVVLGEHDLISPETVPSLVDMARFRNVLERGYQGVDDDQVVAILRSRFGDIDGFVRAASSWPDRDR